MKVMKTVEKQVVDKVICDICEKDVDENDENDSIIIQARLSVDWEGDFRDKHSLDVCRECFFKIKETIETEYKVKFLHED